MVECAVCKKTFENDTSLHGHIKAHKMFMYEYYQKMFPRFDKFDGKLILFKDKEQYLTTDFNSVENMRHWLLAQPDKQRKRYLQGLLEKRQDAKGLAYAPSQVELRSLKIPGIHYLNSVFGNYYVLTELMGFKNRYSFPAKLEMTDLFKEPKAMIFIDSREQTPLEFDCPTEVVALKFGDYSFVEPVKTGCCYIERKSLGDFIGTLSGGYERFEREIIRAKEAGAYLVVLVEEDLANAIKFRELSSVFSEAKKVKPTFVFHNVRELIQKYGHVQFLFVKNRDAARDMVKKLFCYGEQLKKIDLQYYYDVGLL